MTLAPERGHDAGSVTFGGMRRSRGPAGDTPTRESVELSDPKEVFEWISAEGGLRRSGDLKGEFEGMPGWMSRALFRAEGRSLDELAQLIADTGRMSARHAGSAILAALGHYERATERGRARGAELPSDGVPVRSARDDVKQFVDRVSGAVTQRAWRGLRGAIEVVVLGVHVQIASHHGRLVKGQVVYKTDVRTVAQRTSLDIGTVSRAQRRLSLAGWFDISPRRGLTDATSATACLLNPRPPLRRATPTQHPAFGYRCCVNVAGADHDAWRRVRTADGKYGGGLGLVLFRVWRHLSGKPRRAADLARHLHVRRRTCERHLARLASHWLARPSANGWRRGSAELDAVARKLGTLGRGAQQRARHQQQREKQAGYVAERRGTWVDVLVWEEQRRRRAAEEAGDGVLPREEGMAPANSPSTPATVQRSVPRSDGLLCASCGGLCEEIREDLCCDCFGLPDAFVACRHCQVRRDRAQAGA